MTMRYQHILRTAARFAVPLIPPRFPQRAQRRARTSQTSAFRAALSGADLLASSFSSVERT